MTTHLPPHPTPPRGAERLLESLGADAELRDALLGDLAEEYALRAAWDGERAASRWYRREASRVAPHLLRDAVRRLRGRDLRRLARVALISHAAAHFAHLTFAGTALTGIRLLTGQRAYPLVHPWALELSSTDPLRGGAALALLLTLTALPPVLSGFVAASTEDEAPFFPALALGAVQLGMLLVQAALGMQGPHGPAWVPGPSVPTWVVACQCALVLVGPAAGAALRLRDRPRAARE